MTRRVCHAPPRETSHTRPSKIVIASKRGGLFSRGILRTRWLPLPVRGVSSGIAWSKQLRVARLCLWCSNPVRRSSSTAEMPVRVMGMAESSQTQPSRLYIQFARHAGYRPEKGLAISSQAFEFFGGLGRIRTPDPLIRSQVLYPTELPIHREWGFSGGGRVMQDPNAKLLLFCRGGQ